MKKKLSLNRETIAKLDNLFMVDVKGGTLTTIPTTTVLPVKGCVYDTISPDYSNTYNCVESECSIYNCTDIPIHC